MLLAESLCVASGAMQRAAQLLDRAQPMCRQIPGDTGIDTLTDQWIVKQCCSDPHRAGTGDDELDGIAGVADATLADDRNVPGTGDLVHLFDLEQRNWLDRGARQATLRVAQKSAPTVDIDGHAGDRVDDRERIGAGLDAQASVGANIALIGRQLGDQWFVGHPATGLDHACRHFRNVADLASALFDIRTGDVDLDCVDTRVVKTAGDLDIFLYRRTAHVGDETRLAEIQARQYVFDHMIDAWILQADRVEHASRGLIDAVRRVAEARRSRGAFQDNGTDVAVAEPLDPGVLLAKADAPRQQYDRRSEREAAELDRQCRFRSRWFRSYVHGHRLSRNDGVGAVFHVILYEPEIPPNTGNIIRLCANTGARLHLIGPLGFDLDRRSVRRAGLDYDELASVSTYRTLPACLEGLAGARLFAVETGGDASYCDRRYRPGDAFLFGSERC